jgi:DUF4097 and DUF4098 domain-containing protein YvlB
VSGDVGLDAVTSKSVHAETTNGDISFAGSIDPQGRYEFTTHSGDMDLAIPRDASAQVGVSTWNGTIDSDFPITLQPGVNRAAAGMTKHYSFAIGAGSAHITAESFSGDITIRARGGR